MGWYYRKRRGNTTFSLSRRGPRISFGVGGGGKSGCLLPMVLGLTFLSSLARRQRR